MKLNKAWHLNNLIPKKASLSEKIQWHADHARECACRPIPEPIKTKMAERKPKIVVSVLLQNKNKYLLVRERMESGIDKWIIPGGKVEFGESLENAAKREILEETGIKIKKVKFICHKEAIYSAYNYHTVIFFYKAKAENTKIGKDTEGKVKEAKWFTKKEIKNIPLVDSAEWLFNKLEKSFK